MQQLIQQILYSPQLVKNDRQTDKLRKVSMHGSVFLNSLLDLVFSKENLNLGMIREHWRNSKYDKHLDTLMSYEMLLETDSQIQKEYDSLVMKIYEKDKKDKRKQKAKLVKTIDDMRPFI